MNHPRKSNTRNAAPLVDHAPPSGVPAPAYVNERGAAVILGINVRTLQNWRLRGGGPNYRKFGALVRYSVTELHDWAKSQTVASTSNTAAAA